MSYPARSWLWLYKTSRLERIPARSDEDISPDAILTEEGNALIAENGVDDIDIEG